MLKYDTKVAVKYRGTFDDGTVFDETPEGETFEFLIGDENIIQGFDRAVAEMKPGDKKTVRVPAEYAYGEYNPDDIEIVPVSMLGEEEIPVGEQILLTGPEGTTQVFLEKIEDDCYYFNRNHPLAGYDLTFEIELVKIVELPPFSTTADTDDDRK